MSLDLRHPAIASVLAGIARTLGRRQAQVAPILAADLARMLDALPNSPGGMRDRALLLIGFGAALRRSELAALDLEDVSLTEAGLKVLVRFSKADQEGRGQEVGVHRGETPATCPVAAREAWLACRGRGEGPLFQRVLKGGRVRSVRLCDRSIARIVKTAVGRVGLDPGRYSGHSLRSGLATAAAIAGADLGNIMTQTRHKSAEVARRYIRDADIWRNNVSRLVLRAAAREPGA
jgi:integrase